MLTRPLACASASGITTARTGGSLELYADLNVAKALLQGQVDMAAPGAHLDAQVAASMISQYRQNNGLGVVVVDPELMKLAEQQSQAMASRNKMDHDVKAPLAQRLAAGGYPATLAVENISAGYHTLAEAFSGWRDSPPHRENMLKNGVTKLGIAASYAPNTKYKVFWTLILASADKR